ncbi:MAG: outer membrane protein transport protein [Candidatus Aminicenantes bacterium]|nr:outer membrane protein transport protein [Candidatus Aminicenantes bacterium]
MKKTVWLVGLVLALSLSASAGGILTNGNQSAAYVRLLARNASLDMDAVYYNPAGLVKLSDGFHLSLNNQYITQDKTIVNGFPLLNSGEYVGEVRVPVFPDVYAVYKKGRVAFSFGFGPNAGGGSADFKKGLPSFEIPFSTLPSLISSMGVPTTAYQLDMAFKGTSIFLGYQLNLSYAVGDVFSFGLGGRLIQARNDYEGHINDIMINPQHPLINPNGDFISAYDFFMAIGQPTYAALVADKNVKTKQTGSGFTPILSLNYTPSEALVMSLRYEFNTKLELKNKTTEDDTGLFPDGYTFRNDIPAILAAGLRYSVSPAVRAHFAFTYYFDKSANWDGKEELVNQNSYEMALGLEYDLSRVVTASAGYQKTSYSLSDAYQTDLDHELSCDTIGGGFRFKITDKLNLDLGALYVFYKNYNKSDSYSTIIYPVTFKRTTLDLSLGINYSF